MIQCKCSWIYEMPEDFGTYTLICPHCKEPIISFNRSERGVVYFNAQTTLLPKIYPTIQYQKSIIVFGTLCKGFITTDDEKTLKITNNSFRDMTGYFEVVKKSEPNNYAILDYFSPI